MNLGNFYTGFGILLVYFTLVWQNIRQGSKDQIENSKVLTTKQKAIASKEQIKNQRKSLWNSLVNPLNITISIISVSGVLAFYFIISNNIEKMSGNVETIVLFSIVLMHLVISIDLWIINVEILQQIFALKGLKNRV